MLALCASLPCLAQERTTEQEVAVDGESFTLASLDKALRHAGGRPDQVVKVLVFMTDITERSLINPLRIEYFGEHRPASSLVEVSGLVDPRMTVEIEAVAYVGT